MPQELQIRNLTTALHPERPKSRAELPRLSASGERERWASELNDKGVD